MRVRLLVDTTYHPEAGGSRRRGEVFDLPTELGAHWVRERIAEDATDQELSGPRAVAPNPPLEAWPALPTLEPTSEGATVNAAKRPNTTRPRGLQKQGRR